MDVLALKGNKSDIKLIIVMHIILFKSITIFEYFYYINKDNKCKWGCIDVDDFKLDYEEVLKKIRKLVYSLLMKTYGSMWVSGMNTIKILNDFKR